MLSLHSQFKAALHVKAGWQRKVANGGSIRHRSHRRRMREKSWRICRCTAEGEANEGPKFSQKVVEGGKEVRRNLKWSKATVTENKFRSFSLLQLPVAHNQGSVAGRPYQDSGPLDRRPRNTVHI